MPLHRTKYLLSLFCILRQGLAKSLCCPNWVQICDLSTSVSQGSGIQAGTIVLSSSFIFLFIVMMCLCDGICVSSPLDYYIHNSRHFILFTYHVVGAAAHVLKYFVHKIISLSRHTYSVSSKYLFNE